MASHPDSIAPAPPACAWPAGVQAGQPGPPPAGAGRQQVPGPGPVLPPPLAAAVQLIQARRLAWPQDRGTSESVVCESPVELRLNGRSHTILMASPVQLEELALGHCLSEGVVDRAGQVEGMAAGQTELPGIGPAHWVDLAVSPELARRAKLRRAAPAATSCALCGLESFRDLPSQLTPVADSGLVVELGSLFGLLGAMEEAQGVFRNTGGTHAAALGTPQGQVISVAEDIGRHNALDKALGLALSRQGRDFAPGNCLAMLSGRLSYEMALKVARVGIPLVASVSAPTALCVRLLDSLNITVVAFCRPPRATVYTHPRRVAWPAQPPAR